MNIKFWQIPVIQVVEVDKKLTEIELCERLAALMGDLNSVEITKDGAKEIYKDMGKVDGATDAYLEAMMNDIKRYFAAQTEKERDTIRGAFSRTAYFRSLMLDANKV